MIDRIDAALPQTQCRRCGYDDCRAYARALATGEASPNRCAPGGDRGIRVLAALVDRPAAPLDPECGVEGPVKVAWIDEQHCIGCTRCLPVCPVDAIIGASKVLHTVVAAECTGCELCLPVCPVDCIVVQSDGRSVLSAADSSRARERYRAHRDRAEREMSERDSRLATGTRQAPKVQPPVADESGHSAAQSALLRVLSRQASTLKTRQ